MATSNTQNVSHAVNGIAAQIGQFLATPKTAVDRKIIVVKVDAKPKEDGFRTVQLLFWIQADARGHVYGVRFMEGGNLEMADTGLCDACLGTSHTDAAGRPRVWTSFLSGAEYDFDRTGRALNFALTITRTPFTMSITGLEFVDDEGGTRVEYEVTKYEQVRAAPLELGLFT